MSHSSIRYTYLKFLGDSENFKTKQVCTVGTNRENMDGIPLETWFLWQVLDFYSCKIYIFKVLIKKKFLLEKVYNEQMAANKIYSVPGDSIYLS